MPPDQPQNVVLEEARECTPASFRIGPQKPQHALGQEIAHRESHKSVERASAREAAEPRKTVGAQERHHLDEGFASLRLLAGEKTASCPNNGRYVFEKLCNRRRIACPQCGHASQVPGVLPPHAS